MLKTIKKITTSYGFFLWFMRTVTLPVTVGCFYMAFDSYHGLLKNSNPDGMLALLVGLFGGTFSLAYFLVAWCCGWKNWGQKEDNS